jgi:two-component system, chemotaxis family, chemotaxis protein CheY
VLISWQVTNHVKNEVKIPQEKPTPLTACRLSFCWRFSFVAIGRKFRYKSRKELRPMKSKGDFPNLNEKDPEGVRPDGSAYRVLIVDDSMFVAKQLSQILTSAGFEVVGTAGNGEEGVEKYKELHPNVDLVTMDITMPKMDGVTALQQIIDFDKNARVVMISALGKNDLVKNSLMIGAKNYIVKPLDRKKVLERIVLALS